ncbi:Chromatin modification-related protein EAF3 [Porphyridium purpureum]|uniref:Chromatin modification-related protein EAF3 n=1 Tax=Porphyridium purpureum TaxID=35688 RepID=A0A5J4YKR8_PORPP|nr:Chromatin modification-related protein EAF3 [Porphyridium purpureum]|eukprot:POR9735..scf244_11
MYRHNSPQRIHLFRALSCAFQTCERGRSALAHECLGSDRSMPRKLREIPTILPVWSSSPPCLLLGWRWRAFTCDTRHSTLSRCPLARNSVLRRGELYEGRRSITRERTCESPETSRGTRLFKMRVYLPRRGEIARKDGRSCRAVPCRAVPCRAVPCRAVICRARGVVALRRLRTRLPTPTRPCSLAHSTSGVSSAPHDCTCAGERAPSMAAKLEPAHSCSSHTRQQRSTSARGAALAFMRTRTKERARDAGDAAKMSPRRIPSQPAKSRPSARGPRVSLSAIAKSVRAAKAAAAAEAAAVAATGETSRTSVESDQPAAANSAHQGKSENLSQNADATDTANIMGAESGEPSSPLETENTSALDSNKEKVPSSSTTGAIKKPDTGIEESKSPTEAAAVGGPGASKDTPPTPSATAAVGKSDAATEKPPTPIASADVVASKRDDNTDEMGRNDQPLAAETASKDCATEMKIGNAMSGVQTENACGVDGSDMTLRPSASEHGAPRSPTVLNFPGILNDLLIDDWEYVTKQHKLVRLPREPCVTGILNAWMATSADQDGTYKVSTMQVAHGLMDCFNACLGNMLLYRFEREQYNSFKASLEHSQKPFIAAHIYGVEHLIRMLFRMPVILNQMQIPQPISNEILDHVGILLRFIVANGKALISIAYDKAGSTYGE